ncbi:type II toxin-antitoxin system PemK/MazF family toxin [Salmonella enterica]|uniref:type II toxin-antitoxin system PemK/MazF family toxin n=1 Tax=Salmonella enterica TaxID=28901 RepID=UPI0009B163A9|nr:type II toxin-antitoxin system PemK/MazF family toxin [Salmonella enterica]EBW2268523.1 type II toxin-antitoxin system PemK/MazF family toxin [Salmonella enterica subsp. enterica serovar Hillingdon]ECB6312616.1 type II toxin-antitoxin system PemK/MazF family toxin [Salmonella enterica subsp. enterica serovar Chailey]EDR3562111.1 type II toxin-antitoxin system PemK/MazF family toxin [Salmonella enterica subsp. enterica serovar Benue]MIW33704.1 type II toxin-antitoxin system PemK/MazF family t
MVKRRTIPARGEIWHIDGDPQAGKEFKGPHYYLVISDQRLNEVFSTAICVPITSAGSFSRSEGVTVVIDGRSTDTGKITGVALPFAVRSLDLKARSATYAATVESFIIDEVASLLIDIIEPK